MILQIQILYSPQLRSRRGGIGAQGRPDASLFGRHLNMSAAQRRVAEDRLGRATYGFKASSS